MTPPPMEVTVDEVAAILADEGDDLVLIDCRRQNEWDWCRIDGAELLPMETTGSWAPGVAERVAAGEGSAAVVVYCHSGRRSLLVARALRQAGVAHAASMAGGIDAWSTEIDPSVPRYTKADLGE